MLLVFGTCLLLWIWVCWLMMWLNSVHAVPMGAVNDEPGWPGVGLLHQFSSFPVFQKHKKCYVLNILFTFGRCHQSLAVNTFIRYIHVIHRIWLILLQNQNSANREIKHPSVVPPTPSPVQFALYPCHCACCFLFAVGLHSLWTPSMGCPVYELFSLRWQLQEPHISQLKGFLTLPGRLCLVVSIQQCGPDLRLSAWALYLSVYCLGQPVSLTGFVYLHLCADRARQIPPGWCQHNTFMWTPQPHEGLAVEIEMMRNSLKAATLN